MTLGSTLYVPSALSVKGQSKWSVKELFEANLATEQKVLDSLTKLIQAADEDEQDWETYNVLRTLVSDTEDDIQFYTAQLAQIEEIGLQNYLAAQL
ncbi:MAG: ferritin-like domain-containing protein [Methylococcaceae bacterium]